MPPVAPRAHAPGILPEPIVEKVEGQPVAILLAHQQVRRILEAPCVPERIDDAHEVAVGVVFVAPVAVVPLARSLRQVQLRHAAVTIVAQEDRPLACIFDPLEPSRRVVRKRNVVIARRRHHALQHRPAIAPPRDRPEQPHASERVLHLPHAGALAVQPQPLDRVVDAATDVDTMLRKFEGVELDLAPVLGEEHHLAPLAPHRLLERVTPPVSQNAVTVGARRVVDPLELERQRPRQLDVHRLGQHLARRDVHGVPGEEARHAVQYVAKAARLEPADERVQRVRHEPRAQRRQHCGEDVERGRPPDEDGRALGHREHDGGGQAHRLRARQRDVPEATRVAPHHRHGLRPEDHDRVVLGLDRIGRLGRLAGMDHRRGRLGERRPSGTRRNDDVPGNVLAFGARVGRRESRPVQHRTLEGGAEHRTHGRADQQPRRQPHRVEDDPREWVGDRCGCRRWHGDQLEVHVDPQHRIGERAADHDAPAPPAPTSRNRGASRLLDESSIRGRDPTIAIIAWPVTPEGDGTMRGDRGDRGDRGARRVRTRLCGRDATAGLGPCRV